MKFFLAALLALAGVLRAADEIKTFEVTGGAGQTLGFSVRVGQTAQLVTLKFAVFKDATEVFAETRPVDTSTGAKTENFSWDQFADNSTYTVKVDSKVADPASTDSESKGPFIMTPYIQAFTKVQKTGGDIGFTVTINTGGDRVNLTVAILDAATGAQLSPQQSLTEENVSTTTNDNRPFNFTNLPGGKDYIARATAVQVGGTKTDYDFETFSVSPYATITLKDPVPIFPTDGGGPQMKLGAIIAPNGGIIRPGSVKFEYGTSSGNYPDFVEGTLESQADGKFTYIATVPKEGGEFRRGVTYHYRVSVEIRTDADVPGAITTSSDATFTTPGNRAPNANPDTIRLRGDQSITFDPTKNDRDPDGDKPIILVSVSQPSNGTATVVNGQVKYTPHRDATAGDTFTYKIRDDFQDLEREGDEFKFATGTITIIAPGLTSRGLHAAELKDADGNVVGMVRLTGTGGGGVSGKVQLYSKTYTVQGEIDANGHFYFTIPQGDNPPLQLDVDYEPEGESAGAFDVSLASFEKSFSGTAIPNTLSDARRDEIVGKYTIEIPGGSGDGEPAGIGYAQVEVRPWGEVSLKGRLADGTKFSTKGVLAGSDSTPSVSLWFTPEESRFGLTFTFSEGADPTISGQSRWYRGQDRNADFFPDGFYLEPTVTGSRFNPPEKHDRSLEGASKATLVLKDGNISTSISQQIEISKSDRVNFLNANPYGLTLKIDRENGTFKGQFDHPFDDSRRKFNGVILQSQDKGSGMFVGIDQTGSVTLTIGVTNPPTPAPTPTPTTPTPTTPTPTTPNNPNIPGRGTTPTLNLIRGS